MIRGPDRLLEPFSAILPDLQQAIREAWGFLVSYAIEPLPDGRGDRSGQAFTRDSGQLRCQPMRFFVLDVQRHRKLYLSTIPKAPFYHAGFRRQTVKREECILKRVC